MNARVKKPNDLRRRITRQQKPSGACEADNAAKNKSSLYAKMRKIAKYQRFCKYESPEY